MAAKFDTTNWSLVCQVNASTTEVRRVALAELCEAYWCPLYSFARRRGCSHEDACDLTQAFFVHVIEKHALRGVAPEQGRFRAFLLASFKNFQSDVRERSHSLKRGGRWIRVPWNAEQVESRFQKSATANEDPEQLFDREWALTVIEHARVRLRSKYADAGRLHEFEILMPHLAPEPGEKPTVGLARELGVSEGAARVVLHRFRRRFGSAVRAEVTSTLDDSEEVERELQFLLAVLGRRSVAQ
jgi:RNA polymerase sigma factor (sigma-70 family)